MVITRLPEGVPAAAFLDTLNGLIWSKWLVYLCLGAGVYFTAATLFMQVRCIPDMLKQLREGESSEDGISSFQSLMISQAGRVGVGNIAGVATAIAFGGPGAIRSSTRRRWASETPTSEWSASTA